MSDPSTGAPTRRDPTARTAPPAPTAPATGSPPLLALRGVHKRFAGVRALEGVDLEVRAGEVTAVVGDNGAGKSTLVQCVAGLHALDAGQYLVDGAPVLVDDTVTQPLVADRPAGTYTVQWRVTSSDGHPISGTFTFEAATAVAAEPPATSTPSAPADPTASAGAGGSEEATATSPSSSAEPEMTTTASDPAGEQGDPPLSGTAGTVLAGAAALAALVGAGVALVRMRRRS